jgi:hypothetical protein
MPEFARAQLSAVRDDDDAAIEYANTRLPEHTANEWRKSDYDHMERSNAVYKMSYYIYADTHYNRETKQSEPVAWHLTWNVATNAPYKHYSRVDHIAGQDRKRFTDHAAMERYLAGRIKAYESLFIEVSPLVPKAFEQTFSVNGQLLPGYVLEGQERQKTKFFNFVNFAISTVFFFFFFFFFFVEFQQTFVEKWRSFTKCIDIYYQKMYDVQNKSTEESMKIKQLFAASISIVLFLNLCITTFADTVTSFSEATLEGGVLTIGDLVAENVVAFQDEGHGYGYYYTKDGSLYEITENNYEPELIKSDVIDISYSYPYVYILTESGDISYISNSIETEVAELSGAGINSLEGNCAASKDTVYYLSSISQPHFNLPLKLLENVKITNFKVMNDIFSTGSQTYFIDSTTGEIKKTKIPPFEYAVDVFPSNSQMCFLLTSDGTSYFFNGIKTFKLGIKNIVLASRLTEAPPLPEDDPFGIFDLLIPGAYLQTADGRWYRLDDVFAEKPKLYRITDKEIAKLDIQGTPYEFIK